METNFTNDDNYNNDRSKITRSMLRFAELTVLLSHKGTWVSFLVILRVIR